MSMPSSPMYFTTRPPTAPIASSTRCSKATSSRLTSSRPRSADSVVKPLRSTNATACLTWPRSDSSYAPDCSAWTRTASMRWRSTTGYDAAGGNSAPTSRRYACAVTVSLPLSAVAPSGSPWAMVTTTSATRHAAVRMARANVTAASSPSVAARTPNVRSASSSGSVANASSPRRGKPSASHRLERSASSRCAAADHPIARQSEQPAVGVGREHLLEGAALLAEEREQGPAVLGAVIEIGDVHGAILQRITRLPQSERRPTW